MKQKIRTLHVGGVYQISFMDCKSPDYTWFAGEAVFMRGTDEDFGTGEQHYIFKVDEDECCFPELSVGRLLRR